MQVRVYKYHDEPVLEDFTRAKLMIGSFSLLCLLMFLATYFADEILRAIR